MHIPAPLPLLYYCSFEARDRCSIAAHVTSCMLCFVSQSQKRSEPLVLNKLQSSQRDIVFDKMRQKINMLLVFCENWIKCAMRSEVTKPACYHWAKHSNRTCKVIWYQVRILVRWNVLHENTRSLQQLHTSTNGYELWACRESGWLKTRGTLSNVTSLDLLPMHYIWALTLLGITI